MWFCSRASWYSTLRRSGTCSICASLWTQTLMLGCLEEVMASGSLAGVGIFQGSQRGFMVMPCSCYYSSPGCATREGPGADPDSVHRLCETSLRGILPAGIAVMYSKPKMGVSSVHLSLSALFAYLSQARLQCACMGCSLPSLVCVPCLLPWELGKQDKVHCCR